MSFWRNKRVLVTGSDGFLGSNLVKSLIQEEASVITLSRQGINPLSLLRLENLVGQIAHQELGSVEDFERLNTIIHHYQVEVIYHLAALPLVEIGQMNPIKTFEVNVAGTWNVLEAARQNGVSKIVPVSTVHVYGDNQDLPFKEAFYPQPSRPYETSKACADLISQSYADTYELGIEIPRFVNLYGPGDLNFSRIVPKVIKTILAGQNPHLWDSGAVRDFLFVDDAVLALKTLVEKNLQLKKRNRIFNFGSGQPVNVVDLARQIVAIAALPTVEVVEEPAPEDRAKEILQQYVSIEKAQTELNWQPSVSLADGLKQTIYWYQAQAKHFI